MICMMGKEQALFTVYLSASSEMRVSQLQPGSVVAQGVKAFRLASPNLRVHRARPQKKLAKLLAARLRRKGVLAVLALAGSYLGSP